MTDLPQLLTVREVAAYLRLHKNTIARLSERGELPSIRVCKRGDRRYRREDIERYLEAMQR